MTIFDAARQVADQFVTENPEFTVRPSVSTDESGSVEVVVFRLSYRDEEVFLLRGFIGKLCSAYAKDPTVNRVNSAAAAPVHDLVEDLMGRARTALPKYRLNIFLHGPGRQAWEIVRTEDVEIPMAR